MNNARKIRNKQKGEQNEEKDKCRKEGVLEFVLVQKSTGIAVEIFWDVGWQKEIKVSNYAEKENCCSQNGSAKPFNIPFYFSL